MSILSGRGYPAIVVSAVVAVTGLLFSSMAQAQVLPAIEMDASGASTAGIAVGLNAQTVTMVNNPK